MPEVTIIGGGLAGSEAAWQLAGRGIPVRLYEMRPHTMTPAHRTDRLAEIVCSNSLGADGTSSPAGILKRELRSLGSLILRCADESRVPAGKALAVDREVFAALVTERIESSPLITVVREECTTLPQGPVIVAAGPLMAPALAEELKAMAGSAYLSFFDAIAPVVTSDSIDMTRAYRKGRWGQEGDYINCPLDRERYEVFVTALVAAERVLPHDFEDSPSWFEGCLPVEVMAGRGKDTLRFGPMRPVGLPEPGTDREPYAVVQLRQDNREGTLYNLVGFQTSLRWGEQERVFRMIPGLEEAEFARFGVMHRNIYVNAPAVLDPCLRFRDGRRDLFLAGQITGVEGYVESTAMGCVAAAGMTALLRDAPFPPWPRATAIGSLMHYLSDAQAGHFNPMNVNLGIFPPLDRKIRNKVQRCELVAQRAEAAWAEFLPHLEILGWTFQQ